MRLSKALFTLVALVGLTTVVLGETKYVSIMSGVSVGKCRVHIWNSLTNTFKASQIRIKKGEDSKPIRWANIPSYVIVTFTSKNDKITRSKVEKAVKAPPKSGNLYLVWTVEKEE
tara:strand:+ start:60 stop:404 length:345 start_codon:yes stop_codon:yes gene_type:complete